MLTHDLVTEQESQPRCGLQTRCPCCAAVVTTLPVMMTIEPCVYCNRPLTTVKALGRAGGYRLKNVLDLVGAAYGVATSILVIGFMLTEMDARTFAKAFTILLFVIGSLLLVDGFLSVRTKIDRTLNVIRCGVTAQMMGVGKAAAATIALLLVTVGIAL